MVISLAVPCDMLALRNLQHYPPLPSNLALLSISTAWLLGLPQVREKCGVSMPRKSQGILSIVWKILNIFYT